MTKYEELKTRSDKCINNARNAESLWAFNFWSLLGRLLDEEARNLQETK